MDNNENMSFEQSLKRLEEISDILDRGELPLEELLVVFEEGVGLSQKCRAILDKAELKIIEIKKSLEMKKEDAVSVDTEE